MLTRPKKPGGPFLSQIHQGRNPELRFYPFAEEAWWSAMRESECELYVFIHIADLGNAAPRVRSLIEGEGGLDGIDRIQGRADIKSPCIKVPCGITHRMMDEVGDLISVFRSEDVCQHWLAFHDEMDEISPASGVEGRGGRGEGRGSDARAIAEVEAIIMEAIEEGKAIVREDDRGERGDGGEEGEDGDGGKGDRVTDGIVVDASTEGGRLFENGVDEDVAVFGRMSTWGDADD